MPGGFSPEYEIVVERDVMVPMRDGIRLATDIYRPAKDGEPLPGPLPTILGRTSYDKTWRRLWVEPVANYFAPRGYVVALPDLRGCHGSEGTGQYFHTANVHEGEDGYDAIGWIAAQPWSNGRVGMVGSSHGGIVQTVASLTRPPHLTAILVDVAPTNVFAHEAREGGAMCLAGDTIGLEIVIESTPWLPKTCASSMVATVRPQAPSSICRRPISTDLCVLA